MTGGGVQIRHCTPFLEERGGAPVPLHPLAMGLTYVILFNVAVLRRTSGNMPTPLGGPHCCPGLILSEICSGGLCKIVMVRFNINSLTIFRLSPAKYLSYLGFARFRAYIFYYITGVHINCKIFLQK